MVIRFQMSRTNVLLIMEIRTILRFTRVVSQNHRSFEIIKINNINNEKLGIPKKSYLVPI
jgi:hypothetical protein